MKTRLLALALCLCLTLSLCACAPKTDVQPSPDPETSLEPSAQPSEPATDPDPSDAPEASDLPEEDEVHTQPIQTPPADVVSPSAQPTPEATAEPTPEAAEEWTAADIYAMWLTTSEQFPAPNASLVDMSAYLGEFYDLDKNDLESFVFYQPDMSSTLQEVFLAKAKSGKVSTVKAACQGRLEALQEEAEFYTGTGNYVDGAKLETVGDWVVLAACPENDRLVKILKDTVK